MSVPQPLSIGDVVLAGFKICSDRWRDLLKVTAMTVLPATIFGALLVATYTPDIVLDAMSDPALDPDATNEAIRTIDSSEWVGLGVAGVIYVVGGIIANVVALGACISIALHHHEDKALAHTEALRLGISKIGSMLWLTMLSGLMTVVGLILFVLPGIWLFVSWSVAPIVLLREGVKGKKALGRSFKMVRSTFWLVLVVLILELACIFVLQAITGIFPGLLLPATAETNSFAVFFTLTLGGALVGLFAVALHAAITTEMYFALTAAGSDQLGDNEVDRARK